MEILSVIMSISLSDFEPALVHALVHGNWVGGAGQYFCEWPHWDIIVNEGKNIVGYNRGLHEAKSALLEVGLDYTKLDQGRVAFVSNPIVQHFADLLIWKLHHGKDFKDYVGDDPIALIPKKRLCSHTGYAWYCGGHDLSYFYPFYFTLTMSKVPTTLRVGCMEFRARTEGVTLFVNDKVFADEDVDLLTEVLEISKMQ